MKKMDNTIVDKKTERLMAVISKGIIPTVYYYLIISKDNEIVKHNVSKDVYNKFNIGDIFPNTGGNNGK
jgi:hypothetical protein